MDIEKGRKCHKYYKQLEFIHERLPNGKSAAKCSYCKVLMKNTSITRLKTHRKRYPETSSDSLSDVSALTEERNNVVEDLVEKIPVTEEVMEEQLLLEINADGSHCGVEDYTIVTDENLQNIFDAGPSDHDYQSSAGSGLPKNRKIAPIFKTSQATSSCLSTDNVQMIEEIFTKTKNKNKNVPKTARHPSKIDKKQEGTKVSSFIDTMTPKVKNNIDLLLAKFFFGCNIPFNVVESDHFKEFLKGMRPAYTPPTRKTLSGSCLDKIYDELLQRTNFIFPQTPLC